MLTSTNSASKESRRRRPIHETLFGAFLTCMDDDDTDINANDFLTKGNKIQACTPPPSQSPTISSTTGDGLSTQRVGIDLDEDSQQDLVPKVLMSSEVCASEPSSIGSVDEFDFEQKQADSSFFLFRMSYLFVTFVIMLADGLQGTHLYVLYEGYGFSVASLYCLGFLTGAVTAPVTGPMIDRLGRKKSALLYCALEVGINMLEQFPFLSGLIVSRMVGGITTNLLSTVFEAWVDSEYRKRGFAQEQYETLMRDSVIVSNLSAIASGCLAHFLAEAFGPVGPFEGAVTCTAAAFLVVLFLWNENYGSLGKDNGVSRSSFSELKDTVKSIKSNTRVLRICLTQGLTMGSLQIFIFLWSPVLKDFSAGVAQKQVGLDAHGEPAYGLIFGAFMATGVIGGILSPTVRKVVTLLISPLTKSSVPEVVTVEGEGEVRPMAVEFQGALCYFLCGILLFIPCLLSPTDSSSFAIALICFLVYEFLVGVYFPCEGVIRSLYMPSDSRGSMMTIPRIIVNVAVAGGVISTELVSRQTAMSIISGLMFISAGLQLSLVSKREWQSLFGRIEHVKRRSMKPIRSLSSSVIGLVSSSPKSRAPVRRCVSGVEVNKLSRDLVTDFPEIYMQKQKED